MYPHPSASALRISFRVKTMQMYAFFFYLILFMRFFLVFLSVFSNWWPLLFSDKSAKNLVAADFRLPQFLVLDSWLESLTVLRNYIAHHARIWNRRFPQKPELLRRSRYPWITGTPRQSFKLYSMLCCIVYWLKAIDEKNTFVKDFKTLLKKYPTVNPILMGFPPSWSQEPLWK